MNEFIAKFNSYPLGQKIGLLVLVVTLLGVGFYLLYYQDYQANMEAQRTQLKTLQDKQEKLDLLKANRAEVLNRLESLKRQLLVAREQLPASAEVPSLLQRIHNQAKTAGLEIEKFERMTDQDRSYYTEIPVKMELEGTYDELANFFYYIGRMTRIVNIREIKMERERSGWIEEGALKVSALATTFMYNPNGQAAGGAAGAPGAPPRR